MTMFFSSWGANVLAATVNGMNLSALILRWDTLCIPMIQKCSVFAITR